MSDTDLIQVLQCRIRELEDKVDALRISRRVLMNLLDSLDREKREQIHRLQTLNEKLQKNNCRYARAIMFRNVRITELETKDDQQTRIDRNIVERGIFDKDCY